MKFLWSSQMLVLWLSLSLGWSVEVSAQTLPPVPVVPAIEAPLASPVLPTDPTLPQTGSPPTESPALPPLTSRDPNYKPGADLQHLVKLFINDSLKAGNEAGAVNYQDLYTQLLAKGYGNQQDPQQIEYEVLQATLQQYGDAADRFLDPTQFKALLNRQRPPLQAQTIAPNVVYLAVPDLTPATAQQIRQTLFTQNYSRGVVLDLRGSVGYDPQVIADVARLFLPRSIRPLLVTQDRFGEPTEWDSQQVPIAAGFPLAVLVDGNTQQGSVLLAAQLGVSGNTVILGQPTQGTDRQTKFFALPSGAAVELAVSTWQTGDQRSLAAGLVPLQPITGDSNTWLSAGIAALSLPPRPMATDARPNVFAQEGRIGRFQVGLDTRNIDSSLLGNIDAVSGESGKNVFQPNSDLKIFYLQDYILFTYRHLGVVDSFFANRIYTTDPSAQTAEGIRMGSTYNEVVKVYGQLGENGYNEVMPYPEGSREYARDDRYYVNYDAIGLAFAFEVGSNQVKAIGLFRPGS
ncbi:MAG: S41 family peptidase [Cyanobacteriota bacterium]|nr:S41 family peptidase [Cyanobacteriota bacterium]